MIKLIILFLSAGNPDLESEELTALEFGYRETFNDRKFRIDYYSVRQQI